MWYQLLWKVLIVSKFVIHTNLVSGQVLTVTNLLGMSMILPYIECKPHLLWRLLENCGNSKWFWFQRLCLPCKRHTAACTFAEQNKKQAQFLANKHTFVRIQMHWSAVADFSWTDAWHSAWERGETIKIEPQIPARLLYVPAAHDVQEERPASHTSEQYPPTHTLSSLKKAGNLLGPLSCI